MVRNRVLRAVTTMLASVGMIMGSLLFIPQPMQAETPQTAVPASVPLATNTQRDAYFLTLLAGKEPATDSASAATAISTGYKTDDGNLAWLPGDPPTGALTTIAESLRAKRGFAIGAASTVQFSHATPAGFVSHNVNRNNYAAIANEIINTVKPEVVIGGGHPGFNGGDYKYVGGQPTWTALNSGGTTYTHVVTRTAGVDGGTALIAAASTVNLAGGDRLIGVFGGAGNNFDYHQVADAPGAPAVTRGSIEDPTLAQVVTATLGVLSQDPQGLFVMFEQGDIDWSNHANDFENMVGGVWDLDEAVKAAEAYIDLPGGPGWDDTLVIVTSDHSNSYMRNRHWLGIGDLPLQVAGGAAGSYGSLPTYPDGEVTYQSGNHTNELVTLWARGEGAELFAKYAGSWYADDNIVDNTQIYQVMYEAVKDLGINHVILFIGDGMNIEHEIAASRYLYGVEMGLAWHDWRNLSEGWGGYASTWDVTTYNAYATMHSKPAYDHSNFDPREGYDAVLGGESPYDLQPAYAELVAAPASLSITLTRGETISQTITISKTGSANVNWTLLKAPAATWLTAEAAHGMLAYDGSSELIVTVNTTGLLPGSHTTSLTINNPYLDLDIPVNLTVIDPRDRICLPIIAQ